MGPILLGSLMGTRNSGGGVLSRYNVVAWGRAGDRNRIPEPDKNVCHFSVLIGRLTKQLGKYQSNLECRIADIDLLAQRS